MAEHAGEVHDEPFVPGLGDIDNEEIEEVTITSDWTRMVDMRLKDLNTILEARSLKPLLKVFITLRVLETGCAPGGAVEHVDIAEKARLPLAMVKEALRELVKMGVVMDDDPDINGGHNV
jgi:hypothetical protein